MFDWYFLIIIVLSLGSAIYFSCRTRGSQYITDDTDNERQVYAAAQAYKWRLPSDIHKYGIGKTRMKDVTIMLIAVFQKIMGDKLTEHPLLTMCGFANAASTILLYLIGKDYWNASVAFVVSILFLTSLWIWQVALFGGHIIDGTTIFLLTILVVQQVNDYTAATTNAFLWLGVSGALFSLTMFASASSRKYFMLFLAAIFYAKYSPLLIASDHRGLVELLRHNHVTLINIWLPLFTFIGLLMLWGWYKKIVTEIYYERAPRFLNKIINSRGKFTLDHYLAHAHARLVVVTKKVIALVLWVIIIINALGISYFLPVLAGFAITVIFFNIPNLPYNLKQYFWYYYAGQTKGHFRLYVNYFASIGKPINYYMRGAGWRWVPRLFWRFVPLPTALCGLGVIYLAGLGYLSTRPLLIIIPSLAMLLLAISPIAWGEFTKGPQLGRSYLPGFIGMLMFIGYALFHVTTAPFLFWLTAIGAFIPTVIWNWLQLARDIYPARMTSAFLIRKLDALGITQFSTYKTVYNDAVINNINPTIRNKYEIQYINTLNEVKNGYVIIPGTSSKALNLESVPETIKDGDFTKDPALNELLRTRQIKEVAVAQLKTFGTSRFWGHESEVPSYRDLILHEITEKDRWRGYAWIIDMSKFPNPVIPSSALSM
ncbi:MAG: hypothetical protein WC659_00505 [Patescibacteria group bacterium]